MIENIIFGLLILLEIGFEVESLKIESNLKKERSVTRIAVCGIFFLLVISPIIDWGIRWFMLGIILGIQALLGVIVLIRKKENSSIKKSKAIVLCFARVLLIWLALLPTFILPRYEPIKTTGEYSVDTVSYTLTDESREEYFTTEDDNRKVTIQFWYPSKFAEQEEKLPLVIFSHGAFGYRMSNYSTYQELASNGYIVCSIDYTYHSFMTKEEDGNTVIANMKFINNAMNVQNGNIEDQESYKLEQEWMKLRTEDITYVMNYIKDMTTSTDADTVFKSIDLEHIGAFGHSLGGATSAWLGREDKDVDAVIVVDGTMLGETIGYEDGKKLITDVPYPKPIMNIYNELHYEEALEDQEYANMVASKNALDSYEVVVNGSGHINFTDLPIISPSLAKLLGTGDVDARYCIETMNEVILQFFDRYLKSSDEEIPKESIY